MLMKNRLPACIRKLTGEKIFEISLYVFFALIIAVTLYPFLNAAAISLNDSRDTIKGGVTIFPRAFTLRNYQALLNYPLILTGVRISALRTIAGTAVTVFCTSMAAYTVSRADFIFRKFTTLIFLITLYVGGGLIPTFMVIRMFGLHNTFWVYIIPNLVGAYFLIVMKGFFERLPYSLQEAAFIDGANDLTVFFRIILPLGMPVVAVAALFSAAFQWNSWFDTYLFASGNENITTLQFELQKLLRQAQNLDASGEARLLTQNAVSPSSVRMAVTVISVIPVMLLSPLAQKHFASGVTLGAVKG